MTALLVVEAVGGVLLALVAATALAGFSSGGGEGGFVVLVAVVALGWGALLVLAARRLPSPRARLGALAGQVVPLAVGLAYADAPGGLVVGLGLAGLAAQFLATPPVRFVRDR